VSPLRLIAVTEQTGHIRHSLKQIISQRPLYSKADCWLLHPRYHLNTGMVSSFSFRAISVFFSV